MAARKLQTEIDRTLKKVAEGVELFEGIYEKMQASTNQTQKEKLELDLKSQIKKLQRLRDQIKTWVASNDIKDKSALVENRKLIETQMEKFKACEKEMKTKAFSKEGLTQAAKLDPKQLEKDEAMSWLQSQVEELQLQIESAEAEVEALQGAGKKRTKAGSSGAVRLEELETLNERRRWHISRLEIILRLLNNGSLNAPQVMRLKEDVQYFVESNTEEDFDEDEGIYDELNLDEEEEKFGLNANDDDSDESDVARYAAAAAASLAASAPVASSAAVAQSTNPPTNALPASSSSTAPSASSIPPSTAQTVSSQDQISAISSSPSLTHPSVTSPMLSSAASVSQQPDGSFYSGRESPAISEAGPSGVTHVPAPASDNIPIPPVNGATEQQPAVPTSDLPSQMQYNPSPPGLPSSPLPATAVPQGQSRYSPGVRVPPTEQAPAAIAPPQVAGPSNPPATIVAPAGQRQAAAAARQATSSSLSDLVVSYESVKQNTSSRMSNLDEVHKMLEGGYNNVPQPQDSEKPQHYVPRNPYPTSAYYPQTPWSGLRSPTVFSSLDVETLFYVFYYLPGTYQQYLAAKELKKQSWRFHVKYLTWFQRHSEPQAITEEYEQGVYVYFDWEGSWCQRKKSDFRFEYRYLSED
ncbi:hypothetical protein FISHEDRAFT_48451 [Fistulina hepatica ATCC 64428]|uniref:General negative regulator of transcription subunit n=1 Tax=Fistulina hepatica ATCC 64428 TaxID=1128425 RepID=A0A0D7A567_9AGAR|nr:hypothetical protein FISHEDRAFT_48451 [Fistulina hepatica ATCC 64428]